MVKRYWKDTWQYQRILEILDDYWQTEKDEAYVRVTMYFEHKDGQSQEKDIIWRHPDTEVDTDNLELMTLSEIRNLEFVGTRDGDDFGLARNQDGKVVGLKNLRTGHVDYFK